MEDSLFIHEVIKKVTQLDTLNQQELFMVLALFNLKRSCRHQELHDIKKVIGNILLVERNFYKEYLQMHKFKGLPQNVNIAISICFSSCWNLFEQMHSKQPQNNLNNFQISLPQKIINIYKKQSRDIKTYYQQQQTIKLLPIKADRHHTSEYTLQSKDPLIEKYGNVSSLQQNVFKQLDNNGTISGIRQGNNIYEKEKEDQYKINGNKGDQIDNGYLTNQQVVAEKLKYFVNCPCQTQNTRQKNQNISNQNQEYYSCKNCKNCYHYKCLDLVLGNQYIHQKQKCPQCLTTNSNLFTKVLNNQPIIKGWLNARENQNKINKLYFEQHNMIFLNRALEFIKMRLMKISKKTKKTGCYDIFNRSVFIVNEMFLKRLVLRKWMEIQLKQVDQNCKVYYSMVCVGPRSKQQFIEKLIQTSVNQQIYSKLNNTSTLMKQSDKQTYEFSLFDVKTEKIIQLPARGKNCNHFDCFDLMQYYNDHINSNITKFKCIFCQYDYNIASDFVLDLKIYQIVKNIIVQGLDNRFVKVIYNNGEYLTKQMNIGDQ